MKIAPLLTSLLLAATLVHPPAVRADGCCPAPLAAAKPLPRASLYQTEVGFITDAGTPFELRELRGGPVVMVMFFANCSYACPATLLDLARLRELLPEHGREEVRFVMVSFDVERDTPAALQAFRRARGLSEQWVLLHGQDDAVRELAALLGVKFKREGNGQFAHSNLITLLSAEGEIVHQRAGLKGGLEEAARALAQHLRPVHGHVDAGQGHGAADTSH